MTLSKIWDISPNVWKQIQLISKMCKGQVLGVAVKLPRGTPASLIGVPGYRPWLCCQVQLLATTLPAKAAGRGLACGSAPLPGLAVVGTLAE